MIDEYKFVDFSKNFQEIHPGKDLKMPRILERHLFQTFLSFYERPKAFRGL